MRVLTHLYFRIRIESRFISYLVLILWLILTSVFVIKQSLQRPCWPPASLMLVFPPCRAPPPLSSASLFSLGRRGIALANPLWHWGGPPDSLSVRMCAIRLCFDPDRTRGCYTQERKRVASHYLCSLDCASLPVWTGWDSMGTRDRHVHLQISHRVFSQHRHLRRQSVYQDPTCHNSLFLKPHYSSFIVSVGIWQHQFLTYWVLLILFGY